MVKDNWTKTDSSLEDLFAAIPYQLFLHAAEDEGRTEDPTEHKKQKARREEGKVFYTQEFPQAAVVLGSFAVIYFTADWTMDSFKHLFIEFFENPARIDFSEQQLGYVMMQSVQVFAKCFLPVGAGALFIVVLTTMAQTRFAVSMKNVRFNFKKIIPTWQNFKSKTIFSKTQLLNVGKIVFKLFILFGVGIWFVWRNFDTFRFLVFGDLDNSLGTVAGLVFEEAAIICGVLFLISIGDWFIQRNQYIEQLKMTKQEVKEEMKEMDGNPQIRQRQRQRARELMQASLVTSVKEADVVITNPTHFACAVKWDAEVQADPKLVAKGADESAARIRELAKEYGIETIENKPLARALFASVEVNDFIPARFFTPLAEVFALLDKFKNYKRSA